MKINTFCYNWHSEHVPHSQTFHVPFHSFCFPTLLVLLFLSFKKAECCINSWRISCTQTMYCDYIRPHFSPLPPSRPPQHTSQLHVLLFFPFKYNPTRPVCVAHLVMGMRPSIECGRPTRTTPLKETDSPFLPQKPSAANNISSFLICFPWL